MKWREIIHQIEGIETDDDLNTIEIAGINERADRISEGEIFVAIKGFQKDGHDFIDQAIDNGAAIIIGQKPVTGLSVPYVQVEDSRKMLGTLAASYYGYPSRSKLVIGVTGTNGKTTTGLFTTHLLRKAGYTVSFFGTVFNEVNGRRVDSSLTTPSASEIQKFLAESDDETVVIEVSSQGLQQHRMEGMLFDYGLFTNLQHDHLDYHKTIEEYFSAKKKLFSLLKPGGKAVINSEDTWGKKLKDLLLEEDIEVLTVGESDEENTHFTFRAEGESELLMDGKIVKVDAPLPGKHNLLNLAMAGTVVKDVGHDISNLHEMIKDLEPIPGRFEVYKINDDVKAIIDYAHTAEALEAVLSTCRSLYPDHRICHIFGFRGSRDHSKREKMFDASVSGSDCTLLTLDDLNEEPEEIMKNSYMNLALKHPENKVNVIMDRTMAVKQVIDEAEEKTLIILTGKGHEKYTSTFNLSTHTDKETIDYFVDYYSS